MKAAGISEIAVQVGDAHTWCYGDLWTWTNPGASRTVTCSRCQIGCPAGTVLDPPGSEPSGSSSTAAQRSGSTTPEQSNPRL
jgi:hypothetical protein